MKKTRIITKVIAAILAFVLVLGLIIPYVSAAELGNEVPIAEELVSENDAPPADEESSDENDAPPVEEESTDENDFPPMQSLPLGFEYVKVGNSWTVQKTADNTKPAVMLNVPDGFDASVVTIFIGNLQTREVQYFDLNNSYGYLSSMNLEDGYYVIYANGFAWCDSKDNAYAINGGEYQYVYIGDNYNPSLYGVEFINSQDIFYVDMGPALDSMQKIKHNSRLTVDSSCLVYPEDAKLENVQTPTVSEPPQEPSSPTPSPAGTEDEQEITLFSILLNAIKETYILIILIVICFVGTVILRRRKNATIKKQVENDKYDDQRIN